MIYAIEATPGISTVHKFDHYSPCRNILGKQVTVADTTHASEAHILAELAALNNMTVCPHCLAYTIPSTLNPHGVLPA